MDNTSGVVNVGLIFRDLVSEAQHSQYPLPICAPSRLLARLSSAWPDLKLGAQKASLLAAQPDRIPKRAAGLAFQPAPLQIPTFEGRAWTSSTIPFCWKGPVRHAGLGERLLTHSDAAAVQARGSAVAASLVADQLGGTPSRRSLRDDRAVAGRCAFVANGDPAADLAALRHLFQSQEAATIAVLVPDPAARIARVARQAGASVLLLKETAPWAVVGAADAIHAPRHHDLALLGRLAGCPTYVDGVRTTDIDPGLLAAAYLILGSRYLDPVSGRPITCEAYLDRLIEWRGFSSRVPSIACFAGISFWKRRRMGDLIGGSASFATNARRAVEIATKAEGDIAVWASRMPKGLEAVAAKAGVSVIRVEDGFIRSRGLGADFIPPASLIMDRQGIYYDPRQVSDLEAILSEHAFAPDLLSRARVLAETLVARRVTKYNLGGKRQTIAFPEKSHRILVVGQVANDLSVRAGGAGIAPGLPLLEEVRRRHAASFIIYKPHPDVEAGHRPGAVPDADLLRFADVVVRNVEMDSLIEAVDEVHTVTSLAGFEALLRRRRVVTYGQPFYAGWGLTADIHPPPRRGRQLTLDQLVAATLILYPHYIDPVTRLPCSPEQLIERLDRAGDWRTGMLVSLRRGQGALRRVLSRRVSRCV